MNKNIVILTKNLLSVESTKDKPNNLKRVLEVVKKELTDFTYKIFLKNNTPSILFYNTPKLSKRFKIILNGHLDVVAGKPNQFEPHVKGDRLYGRGAIDMKGPAVVLIQIFKDVAENVEYPLGLQLVTDEEIGGFNGTRYQIEKGVNADFAIAGEPTDFKINNKAKGIIWLDITTKGKTAHGAYPWKGDNAVLKMNKFINTLYKTFPIPKNEVWKTTVNVSKIQTPNTTYNKVPDECGISLDIRFVPEDKDKIIKKLNSILPKDFKLKINLNESCQFTEENNDYIERLQKSILKVKGKRSLMLSTHGGADIRHYNKVGCDGITFGPIGKGLHSENEWVSIKSLEIYYEILKDFLLSL